MVLRPASYFAYVHPPHPLSVQAFPGVLRYVAAADIPAGGQNNALSTEFYKPEEVLGWGRPHMCLSCVHMYALLHSDCCTVRKVQGRGRIGNV